MIFRCSLREDLSVMLELLEWLQGGLVTCQCLLLNTAENYGDKLQQSQSREVSRSHPK